MSIDVCVASLKHGMSLQREHMTMYRGGRYSVGSPVLSMAWSFM